MGSQNVLLQTECTSPGTGLANPLRQITHRIGRRLVRLNLALAISRERRDLRGMPPQLLHDMGLTEAEARRESDLPWHNIPANRLRG